MPLAPATGSRPSRRWSIASRRSSGSGGPRSASSRPRGAWPAPPSSSPRAASPPLGRWRRRAGRLEVEAASQRRARAEPRTRPEDADDLLVLAGFLRRPGLSASSRSTLRRSSRPDGSPGRDPGRRRLALAQMDAVPFADRLVEAVERKRSQLVVGLDPRLDAADGAAWRGRAGPCRRGVGRRSLLQGNRRRGGPVRRRRQAADRVLRGARLGRSARARGGVRLRAVDRAARASTRSGATSASPRARTRTPTSSLATAAPRSRTR